MTTPYDHLNVVTEPIRHRYAVLFRPINSGVEVFAYNPEHAKSVAREAFKMQYGKYYDGYLTDADVVLATL